MSQSFSSRLSEYVRKSSEPGQSSVFRDSSSVYASYIDNDDLSRSKIQKLPNYVKTPLGSNLEVVVVLQAIEVIRLRDDLESARVRLKQSEHKSFNAVNYEVQIKELTQRCFQTEREKCALGDENRKLGMYLQQLTAKYEELRRMLEEVDIGLKPKYEEECRRTAELNTEIQKWRARYTAMERSKSREVDELRLAMESQRKSMLDRQIRELSMKHQFERGQLESQSRKLRELLEFKSRENSELSSKIFRLQTDIEELQRKDSTIAEQHNNIALLSQEIFRLNGLLGSKQDECESLNKRLFSCEGQIAKSGEVETQNRQIRQMLGHKQAALEEKMQCISRLQSQLSGTRQYIRKYEDLQSQNRLLQGQQQKLSALVRDRLQEIQVWRQRTEKLNAELARAKTSEAQLEQAQNKILVLQTQVDRLNNVLRDRLQSLEDWKERHHKLQINLKNYQALQQEFKNLQQGTTLALRQAEDFKVKFAGVENEKKVLEGRLTQSQLRNGGLMLQTERLNRLVKERLGEIQGLKLKNQNYESRLQEYSQQEIRIAQFEARVKQLTQDNDRLGQGYRSKCSEIEGLFQRLKSFEEQSYHYKQVEERVRDYQLRNQANSQFIAELKQQNQDLSNQNLKLRGYQSKSVELSQMLNALHGEVNFKNQQLKKKQGQVEEMLARSRRYEAALQKLKEYEVALMEKDNRVAALGKEGQRLSRMIFDRDIELTQERNLSNSIGCMAISQGAELQRYKNSINRLYEEYNRLMQLVNKNERTLSQFQVQKKTLALQLGERDSKLRLYEAQFEQANASHKSYEMKLYELQRELDKHKDCALQMTFLSSEISRLSQLNSSLEEDLRTIRLRYSDSLTWQKHNESQCLSLVLLAAEVESLRSRISQKESELQSMRKSMIVSASRHI